MIGRHLPRALLYAAAGFAFGVLLAAGCWAARHNGWETMPLFGLVSPKFDSRPLLCS